jgi:peptide deformylase
MVREVRIFGDPVLREPSSRITAFDEGLRSLAEDLIETMRAEQGVGLAAQQVGITDAVCVVEVPEDHDVDEGGNRENPELAMPAVLVNPSISRSGEESWILDEGCLSFPGITAAIERPTGIDLVYQDLAGETIQTELHGFVARVVQHEVDHLNGVLFTDRMTHVKKVALSGRLKRMRRETQERLRIA